MDFVTSGDFLNRYMCLNLSRYFIIVFFYGDEFRPRDGWPAKFHARELFRRQGLFRALRNQVSFYLGGEGEGESYDFRIDIVGKIEVVFDGVYFRASGGTVIQHTHDH